MRFAETELVGAYVIDVDKIEDERGFFARTFCEEDFASHGLDSRFVQSSISYNWRRGTLRGLHYQKPPHDETKVVRCTRGAIWDVIVDLRQTSTTFGKWAAFELSDDNRRALYVPKGFAHGFQSLTDDSEVSYLMSARFEPRASAGVRYDDPQIAIPWPLEISVVSAQDSVWPGIRQSAYEVIVGGL